ncbi:MarR family transcriptional regulator [Frankia sp. AiPa1]|nr:MarR family transcriptional regulator [Frankia sp. AiPa1]MCL9759793.1 MarR family transcriptional regulator [Frankia sp. AiPa1]
MAQLAEGVARLQRTLGRARGQILRKAREDVEQASQILITYLAGGGPMRLGALATAVQSDPSTVSRQVAGLVRDGYVERRPDPDDRRAVVLAVTEAGERAYQDHVRMRAERYAGLLAGWSTEDVETLATLLHRLDDEIETRLMDGGR